MSLSEFKTRKTVRRWDVIGPPTQKQNEWDEMVTPPEDTIQCQCSSPRPRNGPHRWGWSACRYYLSPGMRPLDDGTTPSRLIWTKKEDLTP